MNVTLILFSLVLLLASILGAILAGRARASARDYLRFAAALYLALSLASLLADLYPVTASLSQSLVLLVSSLAPAALALSLFAAFEHPPSAIASSIVLLAACIAGIAAAASGSALLSLMGLMVSVFAILTLASRQLRLGNRGALHAMLSALCLVGAAASSFDTGANGRMALALFSAAGLLGIALAVTRLRAAVAEERQRHTGFAGIRPGR